MRSPPARTGRRSRLALAASVAAAIHLTAAVEGARAQGPLDASRFAPGQPGQPGGQMLLQSDTIVYDNDRQVVTAEGGVQIVFNGNTVLARRVVYYRQTRRLVAEGGVRITDSQNNVTNAETIDLSEDFREGFVRSLRLERAVDRTRFSADSGERRPDNVTIFERGTYTACEPCADNPERPPLWQVRAARIIHNQQEQRIYYENSRLEVFGVPVAYIPYFWSPDGSTPRQSGFLTPSYVRNSRVGHGARVPYYLALSPFYDLTVTPTYYVRQGVHLATEFRQALPNGAYRVRLSGILQQDPSDFSERGQSTYPNIGYQDPGDRRFRGGIESVGEFRITDRWRFGWNVAADTDQRYFQDYGEIPLLTQERISELYILGQGERSFFETRAYHFRTYTLNPYDNDSFENFYNRGLRVRDISGAFPNDNALIVPPIADQQRFMPVVAPVTDYRTAIADPFVGGEFRLSSNVTHVTRLDAMAYRFVDPLNPAAALRYRVPGFAGDYTRASVDMQWRRTFTDPLGQRWTPFVGLRSDVYDVNASDELYTAINANGALAGSAAARSAREILPQFFNEETTGIRAMPMAGFEYRYPFLMTTPGMSHIIEPIAQVIVRPNESSIGRLPNEDAQSLVFDDTTLFSTSKFSGYDRIEGGSRANVGLQYTLQSQTGFLASLLFGQSIQLAGLNSFAQGTADLSGVGLDSGLETRRSDYVARLLVQPWAGSEFTARFRFDEETFAIRRMDVGASLFAGPVTLSTAYTFLSAQPDLANYFDREYVSATAGYRLTPNWSVTAGGTYALSATPTASAVTGLLPSTPASGWVSNQIGLRYLDDCFIFALDYQNVYSGFSSDLVPQQRIMARFTLRTLGDFQVGTSIGQTQTAVR
jgi:LPS-assembly protein